MVVLFNLLCSDIMEKMGVVLILGIHLVRSLDFILI